MAEEPVGTKLALIEAAGELFAEQGYEGTSVRAIAEKAGANVAAVNYHFGSKENLYTEVMRHTVGRVRGVTPSAVLEADGRFDTSEGAAEIIRDIVKADFAAFYAPGQPRWHGRLIMRSLLDPTPPLREVVKQIFEPDHEALKAIFRRAQPEMTEDEARYWAFSLMGQILFYEFCREPLLLHLQQEQYDADFLAAAAEHIARTTIAALGLPQPESGAESDRRDALASLPTGSGKGEGP